MSPRIGKEIYLTEIEVEIMSVFVRHKILDDENVIRTLRILTEKLQQARGEFGK